MKTTISQLEMILTCWEDLCFLNGRISVFRDKLLQTDPSKKAIPMLNPFKHFGSFRQDVLEEASILEVAKKYLPNTLGDIEYLRPLNTLPLELACWAHRSRRVFHLDSSLQLLLGLTSLKKITLADIELPFNSFGISLSVPIVDYAGNLYDFILVTKVYVGEDHSPYLFLRLICQDIGDHKPLTWFDKEQLNKAAGLNVLKPNAYKKIREAHNSAWEQVGKILKLRLSFQFNIPTDNLRDISFEDEEGIASAYEEYMERLRVERNETGESEHMHSSFTEAVRIVAGFALYLSTLPVSSRQKLDHLPVSRLDQKVGTNRKSISSEADICAVTSVYQLTPHERKVVSEHGNRSMCELEPKWVMGYWRRPKGLGSDPSAKRTEWVRPYVRGWDYRLEGELIGGAMQHWKTE